MRLFPTGRKLFGAVLLAAGLVSSCSQEPPPLTPRPTGNGTNHEPLPPDLIQDFLRVRGRQIVTGAGEEVILRGMAFGNEVWQHTEIPSEHHDGRDYERVRKMGMNSVRFYMSYRTFEEDDAPGKYKQAGWDWLDQNVEWAQKNQVRLVLNMHAPAGGYQSQGKGAALWDDPKMQDRFINLWHAIAERYRAEPTIAGYGLLNEPVPEKSIDQWRELAERTIKAIRLVDQHHMIFVEKASAVGGDWSENKDRNFFRVSDDNVVYEFHFYKPFHFTHQNAEWSDFAAREGWYPDEQVPEVEWYQLKTEAVAESAPLPPGDSDWTMLETEAFVARDTTLALGKPFLVCDQGGGSAIFDSLSLTELVAANEVKEGAAKPPGTPSAAPTVETVFEVDLDTRRGWYFWDPGQKGKAEFVPEGNGDKTALAIMHTEGPANLGSDPLRFFVQTGHEYQLQGLARGEGLADKSSCKLRLEFYSSKVPVQTRSKAYLAQELDAYVAWGKREKVPLYLGEFGTIRDSFLPGRGGVKWVADMLDLIMERDLSFAYHAYHEVPFGLMVGDRGLPSVYAANLPLYEAIVRALLGPDADTELVPTARVQPTKEKEPAKKPEKGEPPAAASDEEPTPDNDHDFE